TIAELEFNKVDVAIHENGTHLRPSEVAAALTQAAQKLRIGPALMPAAFSVQIGADDPDTYERHLRAVCRLARICSVPLITLSAASAGSGLDAEVERLTKVVQAASSEGILATGATLTGTPTELPDDAAE